MRRIAIRIANGALFVLCCFIAGGVVSEISASLLIPNTERPWSASEPIRPSAESWSERQVILDRNVFGALVREADVVIDEPPPEPIQEEIIETDLPLRLLATVAGSTDDVSRAVIEDKSARKHEVLMVGQTLANHPGVSLAKIERRRVQLDNAGVLETLSLDDDEVGGASPALSRTPARTSRSSRSARTPTEPRSSRGRLADRLKKLRETNKTPEEAQPTLEEEEPFGLSMQTQMELFSQARIMPKYEEGQMVGIQLNKIKTGSLYEKVGLADGDVITEVNGITIDRPAASPQFIEQLAEAEFLDIAVVRADGTEENISVATEEIRSLE